MPKSPRFPKLDPNAKRSKRNRITFLSAETYQLLRAEGFDFEDISVVLATRYNAALRDIKGRPFAADYLRRLIDAVVEGPTTGRA